MASVGGLGGATVGRFIGGAGRMLIEFIPSCCDTNGEPRIVPKCCAVGNAGPATVIGGDLEKFVTFKKRPN